MFLGEWQIDDLLTFPANTHDPITAAGIDADSVPTYRLYEDETGTAILTGSMAKLDDTNTIGFYSEQLTLSAANGFEVGKCYTIYITATVDSIAGTMSHTFKIVNLAEISDFTDAMDAIWGAAWVSAGTVAGLVTTLTTLVTGFFRIICRKDAAAGTDEPGLAALTLVNSNEGGGAGAYNNTTMALEANRDNIGTAGAGLTAADDALVTLVNDLPTNAELATALGTADDATLAAIATLQTSVNDIPTNSEMTALFAAADDAVLAAIAGLNNLSAGQVSTEVAAALVAIHLDHLLAVTYDPASKPGAADALLNELVESDGGVARFTANALEEAPSGGSAPTAEENADALLDRDMSAGADTGDDEKRTPRQAFRFLRNKWSVVGSTLTITKEDDTTTSHTAAVGTTPAADPVTSVDPTGP